jgi:hypothetical protein
MRFPRPWITVRRTMILVAVLAIALGAGMMRRRQLLLRERAAYHERIERKQSEVGRRLEDLARASTTPEGAAEVRADKAYEARIGSYHALLKQKYRHLSARPWLSIEPDPPEP